MRRWITWLTAGALLVAAWLLAGATPDAEQRLVDPFPVTAQTGVSVEAGNLGVRIHDAQLADRVETGGWYAEGLWLVVTLDAWLVEREPASLGLAYLVVGDRSYLVSERVEGYDADAAIGGWGLHVGVPQTGTAVFELPADLLDAPDARSAVLELALGTPLAALSPEQNQHGGAVIEVPIDLTALERSGMLDLPDTEWTTP